jgi:hypothetical protein
MGIVNPEGYCSSAFTSIAQLVITSCFHITGSWVDEHTKSIRDNGIDTNYGTKIRVPEYSFESDFVSGLNESDDEGYPVRSKWTITLFFKGDQREFVHRWQTIGTWDTETNSGTSWSGHWNKLQKAYREGPEITEIIKRFEKRPAKCNIDPEKDEVFEGDNIKIKITDLKDESGQTSREFNRIIVHADHGRIKNGGPCEIGPEYKVFKVGDGNITVQYEAPQNCDNDKDKITVYNSCEVLPENKVSFRSTKQKDKISEKELTIKCYDAVLTITKTQHKEISTSEAEKKPDAGCTTEIKRRHDLEDVVEATIKINLKAEVMSDMPVLTDQKWVSYRPVNAELTKFNFNYNETEYDYRNTSGGKCDTSRGNESTLTIRREIINKPVVSELLGPSFIVAFDTKTNKAIKLNPGTSVIEYGFSHVESLNFRQWPKNDPDRSHTNTWKMEHFLFNLSPVEDPVPDPTGKINPGGVKEYLKGKVSDKVLASIPDIPIDAESANSAKIHPDQIVKTGDGINEFGGEGRKETEKQVKGGTEREVLTFKWNMKRNVK